MRTSRELETWAPGGQAEGTRDGAEVVCAEIQVFLDSREQKQREAVQAGGWIELGDDAPAEGLTCAQLRRWARLLDDDAS